MINPATEIIEVEQTAAAKAVYRDLAEQTDTLAPAMRRSLAVLFGRRFRYPTPKALILDNPWEGCGLLYSDPVHKCPSFGKCRQGWPQLYVSQKAEIVAMLLDELANNDALLDTQRQDYRQLADAWVSTVAASVLLLKHVEQLDQLASAAIATGRHEQAARTRTRIAELNTSVRQLHTQTAPTLFKHAREAKAEIVYQTLAAELDMQASNPIVDVLHQQVDDAIKSIAVLPALTQPKVDTDG